MRSLLKVQRQCKWHAAKWPFQKFCASVAVSDKPYAGVTCVQGVVDLGAHWRPARQHRRVPSHLRPEFPQLVLQGPRDLPTQQLGEPVHPHFRPAHVWRRPLHLRVRHLPVGQRAGHHRSRHVGWALHFSSIFFLLLLPCCTPSALMGASRVVCLSALVAQECPVVRRRATEQFEADSLGGFCRFDAWVRLQEIPSYLLLDFKHVNDAWWNMTMFIKNGRVAI